MLTENMRGGAAEFESGFSGYGLDIRDTTNAVCSKKFF
jgi:hypothetical protein